MTSVTTYEPVHFVTKAKAASNPKGLKNVARMRLIVAALCFTIGVAFHEWIFLKEIPEICKKIWVFPENLVLALYITFT